LLERGGSWTPEGHHQQRDTHHQLHPPSHCSAHVTHSSLHLRPPHTTPCLDPRDRSSAIQYLTSTQVVIEVIKSLASLVLVACIPATTGATAPCLAPYPSRPAPTHTTTTTTTTCLLLINTGLGAHGRSPSLVVSNTTLNSSETNKKCVSNPDLDGCEVAAVQT
jgi:hypothetical protein